MPWLAPDAYYPPCVELPSHDAFEEKLAVTVPPSTDVADNVVASEPVAG
jgi:hypothetical protein